MEIFGVIIAGIIIGLLGKFLAPGDKDNIPIWLTGGSAASPASSSDGSSTPPSAATAAGEWTGPAGPSPSSSRAVLVVVASTVTGRNTVSRKH